MAERTTNGKENGKKRGGPATLDLMSDEEAAPSPRAARKATPAITTASTPGSPGTGRQRAFLMATMSI